MTKLPFIKPYTFLLVMNLVSVTDGNQIRNKQNIIFLTSPLSAPPPFSSASPL